MTLEEFLEGIEKVREQTNRDINKFELVFEYKHYVQFEYPIEHTVTDMSNDKIILKANTKNTKETK